METTDWIFESNLRPFLETLAWIVGYEFVKDEWDAISNSLRESDAEKDHWYEYEFFGPKSVKMKIARDSGTSVVQVKLALADELRPQLNVAVLIFQRADLKTL